jgi:hypothetical protein
MKPRQFTGFGSALLAVALTLGGLVGATPATADSTCPDGLSCFWPLQNFEGNKVPKGNSPEGVWVLVNGGQAYHSAKNRYTNRAVWTAKPNQNLHCTPSGGNSPTAPEFTYYFVGGVGSHC